MEKARAMVLVEFGKPLELQEFPVPEPEEGEILVEILASGVCGSDVHMQQGEDPRIPLPIILGHEGIGRVARMQGKKISVERSEIREGDVVFWNRGVVCGECFYCTEARQPHMCPKRWVYGIHRSPVDAPHLVGCYADYLLLDKKTELLKPEGLDEMDPAVVVAASCSGATAAHAMEEEPPPAGGNVLIQGPGPLGLFLVAFAKQHGAANIMVIGDASRLEICREFGAAHTFDFQKTSAGERAEAIRSLTHGRGADVCYEAVGSAAAFEEGLKLVRHGGAYVSIGFGQPGGTLAFDPFAHLVRPNYRLKGIWVSHTAHTITALEAVMAQPELFGRMVTHRFPLERANEALEVMRTKEALKAVLVNR